MAPVAPAASLTLEDARRAVADLRDDLASRAAAGTLFGQERGEALAAVKVVDVYGNESVVRDLE